MADKLVCLKTAVMAKDKGFDLELYTWLATGSMIKMNEESREYTSKDFRPKNFNRGRKERYSQPTLSTLQLWIRTDGQLHVMVDMDFNAKKWFFIVTDLQTGNLCLKSDPIFTDYDVSWETGLFEALKLLPNRKTE